MSLASYGITRNVDAHDKHGRPVKIALVVIKHENGHEFPPLAIREDEILFAGEGLIEMRVAEAANR